jgi:hypothetical protein
MANVTWSLRGQEFVNCNCDYGCPCQFNALPTHGNCKAVIGLSIDEGRHGDVRLDGLKVAAVFAWPRAIHEGNGEAFIVIDKRATDAQRDALLRILSGQDTDPGTTVFAVFATTLTKVHEPLMADVDFDIDVERRTARLVVPDQIEARGEPIRNPVTGAEHRIRFDNPNGFEFHFAEVGRGWSKAKGAIAQEFSSTHAHFAAVAFNQNGVVS